MENIKKYKNIYIIVCSVVVVICIIICVFIDKNNRGNNNQTAEIENTVEQLQIGDIEEDEKKEIICIHISGEVVNPGTYELEGKVRIKEVVDVAGGLTENADLTNVNLAYCVNDGQKINIPNVNNQKNPDIDIVSSSAGETVVDNVGEKKININTATQTELETLTGIGPSTASKIIDFRSKNGKFKKNEDIKNVAGIGESKYESIKNEICVN